MMWCFSLMKNVRVLVMDEAHIVFNGDPKHATDFYTQLIRSKYQSMSSR